MDGDEGSRTDATGRGGERRLARRAFLVAGATGLSGCSGLLGAGGPSPTDTATAAPTATPIPLPYASENPEENLDSGWGIEVRNRTDRERYVTVLVEDGDRTLFIGNREVPPRKTIRFEDIVRRIGVYDVVVETADGARAVHGWTVGRDVGQVKLIASLTEEGVTTSQQVFCTPECAPLSRGGESVRLPREDPRDPGTEVFGVLHVRNGRTKTAPLGVAVSDGDRTLVDYRYDVPPGVSIYVPVADDRRSYDLRIESDAGTVATTWHVAQEPYPTVDRIDTGPTPRCPNPSESVELASVRSTDDVERDVDVSLLVGGTERERASFALAPTGERTDVAEVPLAGFPPFEIRVTVDGTSASASWTLCPPSELTIQVLNRTLYLRTPERILLRRAVLPAESDGGGGADDGTGQVGDDVTDARSPKGK